MKKRRYTICIVSILLVCLSVGITFAFFTDSKEKTNIITMGNVDIRLDEPLFDEQYENSTATEVTPGSKIIKDPTISLIDGSQAAYIRATIQVEGNLNEIQKQQLIDGIILENGWYKNDNYYYYNQKLTTDNSVKVLFKQIVIPSEWNNEMANVEYKVIVKAEAIQADNFTPSIDSDGNIINWKDSKGNTIKTQ